MSQKNSKKNFKNLPDNEAIHFLHDLLNHTHGLKLFLESREESVSGVGKESLELIYNEIQALENQIASQFDKITDKKKSYSLDDLIIFVGQQFDLYQLAYSIHFDNTKVDSSTLETIPLSFNLFERMIKNIVKNIYLWSSGDEVQLIITFNDGELFFQFENKISHEPNQNSPSHGVGLHSLKELASKQMVKYKNWIENEKWMSLIQIKTLGEQAQKKAS